jgi:hypothetical protein
MKYCIGALGSVSRMDPLMAMMPMPSSKNMELHNMPRYTKRCTLSR